MVDVKKSAKSTPEPNTPIQQADSPAAPETSKAPASLAADKSDTTVENRVTAAAEAALVKTGQVVNDTPALVAEARDQLITEANAVGTVIEDEKMDTLTLEQLDHARTLADALGVSEDTPSNEELIESAKARVEKLKAIPRDKQKDKILESIPANWRITPKGKGQIEAINIYTGRTFEGSPKDLLKSNGE